MRWTQLPVAGAWTIAPEPTADERGCFARVHDAKELRARGLADVFAQTSIAWNARAGTIRGLHFQRPPAEETKIVRCTRGAAYDVIADLRPASPSFGRTAAVALDESSRMSVYIPAGCAHGYQTLADETELEYAISTPYAAELADGVRYDDPELGIVWPLIVTIASDRDRALGTFRDAVGRAYGAAR